MLVASEDTLSLILETVSVILEVEQGRWVTIEMASSLVGASLNVWSKNNKGDSPLCARLIILSISRPYLRIRFGRHIFEYMFVTN